MTETTDTKTGKYLVQTRSQARSSGIKVPEVHSMDKGLILHIRPEYQKLVAPATCLTPSMCHTRPTHQPQPMDQRLPTNVVPPLPKPRIGQGRAGIRRKPKLTPPTPKPIQTLAPPIPTPVPRAMQPLPVSVIQLQEKTLTAASCASSAAILSSTNPSKHHTAHRA